MSQENPLSERVNVAVTPELKRAAEKYAAELKLDFPSLIRGLIATGVKNKILSVVDKAGK